MGSVTALIDDLLKHPPASPLELASRIGHDSSALTEAMLDRLFAGDCTPRDEGLLVIILAELLASGERADSLKQVLEDRARSTGSRALAFILLQSIPGGHTMESLGRLPREDVEAIFAAALEWTDTMASVELELERESADSSVVPRSRKRSVARGKAPRRGTREKKRRLLTMKIALRGARPPIWRRLVVPDDMTFGRFHDVIQTAFDWDDSHLHMFEVGRATIGPLDIVDLAEIEEEDVTLREVLGRNKKFSYTYDFGDDWIHDVVVEKTEPGPSGKRPPARCIGGRRAAPPEDCGGVWGYQRLLQILADPGDPEHEELMDWAGEIDPAEFDAGEVDRRLAALG